MAGTAKVSLGNKAKFITALLEKYSLCTAYSLTNYNIRQRQQIDIK